MPAPLLLLIEDDETVCLGLRTFFEKTGYEVIIAHDGAKGLGLALREIPDTIILDLRLPDIHGLELLKNIKQACPEISKIIMTGSGEGR